MSKEEQIKKLLDRVQTDSSKWMEKAIWRQTNSYWLKHSQRIAVKILIRLREVDMTKEELREYLEMSPEEFQSILSGHHNMDLMTIGKIERALAFDLIKYEVV